MSSQLLCALVLALASTLALGTDQQRRAARTIYVKSGQKIQKAIKSAPPGSEIVVAAGTYYEQILIKKDGIRLRGEEGAILQPPATPVHNACSGNLGPGTQVGICIAGSGIKMAHFITEHRKVLSVDRPVKGVSVSGFQVQSFAGNILALGTEQARIQHNTLINGSAYGLLASGSRNTVINSNTITSPDPTMPGGIAICMDNFSGAYCSSNAVTFYLFGLCIQTDGAELHDNDVSYTCRGAFADPYVEGIRLSENHLHNSYNACSALGSYGVTLAGSKHALVYGNLIEEIRNDGPSAGIYVADDPCTEVGLVCSENPGVLVVAEGNKVIGNKLRSNDLDIWNNSTGSGNVFRRNRCSSSLPRNICRGQ